MDKNCEHWLDDKTVAIFDWHIEDHYSGNGRIAIENMRVLTYIQGFDYDVTDSLSQGTIEIFQDEIIDKLRADEVA